MSGESGSSKAGGHAVVIGGSMSGLFAARVLADHFERVTIVDRDHFPKGPEFRKGVPQSRHLHAFLARGRQLAERLFPGIEEDLTSSGAIPVDTAEDALWLTPAGLAPRYRSEISVLTSTRNLLEWTVRNRVASLPRVRFLERTEVTRLLPARYGTKVAGVKVRSRERRNEAAPEEPLHAELVVDASGRNSRAPWWLKTLGYPPPEETRINAHPGYATRLFERPEDPGRGWKVLFVQVAPPEHNRGGIMFPIEGGRWMCSLVGMGGDYAPTDEGFIEFARSLRSPMLYEAIKDAKPASPIHGYREVENRRRHYEKLPGQPDNFLVTGDAACSFNPVYGQGMTTAALGTKILEGCLQGRRNGDFSGLSRRFQKRLAKVNAAPWLLATGEDFRVRGTEGGKVGFSTRFTHRYMDRVLELSLRDLAVRQTFLEVFGMLKTPTGLFGPAIAAKVLRDSARRKKLGGAAPPGQPVPEAS